jgi:hypothetical protein
LIYHGSAIGVIDLLLRCGHTLHSHVLGHGLEPLLFLKHRPEQSLHSL